MVSCFCGVVLYVLKGTTFLLIFHVARFFLFQLVGSATSGVMIWSKITGAAPISAAMLELSSGGKIYFFSVRFGDQLSCLSLLALSLFRLVFVSFSAFFTGFCLGFLHFLILSAKSLSSSPSWQGTIKLGLQNKSTSSQSSPSNSSAPELFVNFYKPSILESNASRASLTIDAIQLNSSAFYFYLFRLYGRMSAFGLTFSGVYISD